MIYKEQVEAALGAVYDPCSVKANAPLSVVNMGLVTGIDVDDTGGVRIKLRPTSPWCTLIACIMQGVEDEVRKLDGIGNVTVEIDNSSQWSEASLTPEGRDILHATRARSRAVAPVRRQQWKERMSQTIEG
jgi:metal-sulfur cluster biosynthetic enzyme